MVFIEILNIKLSIKINKTERTNADLVELLSLFGGFSQCKAADADAGSAQRPAPSAGTCGLYKLLATNWLDNSMLSDI